MRLPVDQIFINEAVSFSLVDAENGVTIDRPSWGIASPHNVPGDRGIMRSDGLYTAPRLIPEPRTIRIWARSQNLTVFADIEIHDPDRPDTDATARPGGSHTHPVFGLMSVETSKPIEGGLRVGDSVAFSAFDRTGRPLVVDHYEIKHDNKVSITRALSRARESIRRRWCSLTLRTFKYRSCTCEKAPRPATCRC